MRQSKPIAMAFGLILGLIVLSFVFSLGSSEPKSRKIAEGLLEIHRQWNSTNNIPSLYVRLTNLPFQKGGVIIADGGVSRRYNFLGLKWEQYYYIHPPATVTNESEWTLCHAWYWYPPSYGRKELATFKLVTIKTD